MEFFFQDPTYVKKVHHEFVFHLINLIAGKKVFEKKSHLPTKNNTTTLIVHQVTPAPGTLERYRSARPGRGPQVFPAFPAVCNGWKKEACAWFSPMVFLHWPGIKYRVILKVVLVIFWDTSWLIHQVFMNVHENSSENSLKWIQGYLHTW